MSGVDESDYCPEVEDYDSGDPDAAREFGNIPADIDNMVVVAVPAGPAKVITTNDPNDWPKATPNWHGLSEKDFLSLSPSELMEWDNHKVLPDRLTATDKFTLPDTSIPDFGLDPLEDLSIQEHERLTLFERQSVLHAIRECDKFSDKYKDELGLKLSILWESV